MPRGIDQDTGSDVGSTPADSEAVQVKCYPRGSDVNTISLADGDIPGQVVASRRRDNEMIGVIAQRIGVTHGNARLDLVERFHGRGRRPQVA